MRVFFAVTFDAETKEKLRRIKELVLSETEKGRFSYYKNYHITIEFIGEVNDEKVQTLKNIINKLENIPQYIKFNKLGSFKRKNKEIVWIGIEKNEKLNKIHDQLIKLLKEYKFSVDRRPFTPHLTIGRQVIIDKKVEEIDFFEFKVPINSIALMESKRVNGKLIYEPLQEIKL